MILSENMARTRWRGEEKHEPVSDIDTGAVDSLKVLDPKGPIKKRTLRKEPELSTGAPRHPSSEPKCSVADAHGDHIPNTRDLLAFFRLR